MRVLLTNLILSQFLLTFVKIVIMETISPSPPCLLSFLLSGLYVLVAVVIPIFVVSSNMMMHIYGPWLCTTIMFPFDVSFILLRESNFPCFPSVYFSLNLLHSPDIRLQTTNNSISFFPHVPIWPNYLPSLFL